MTATAQIGLATFAGAPRLTADDSLLIGPLRDLGIEARPVRWDDQQVRWGDLAAVIIRSCWDYHVRQNEFRGWLGRLEGDGVAVWNPPDIVRWNMTKSYLRDLAGHGIAIPRTVWLARGTAPSLEGLLVEHDLAEAVVKPQVSATARETWLTTPRKAGADQARFARLVEQGAVMVQEFVRDVATAGEWSLIFLGGRYSHAVVKHPAAGDFRVQAEFGGSSRPGDPPGEVVEQARRIVSLARGPVLYARVDGVALPDGFLLGELELIEPELFLRFESDAAGRLAAAIGKAVEAGRQEMR